MKGFQIIVLGVFAVMAIAGVLIFSGVGGLKNDEITVGSVEIWGFVDERVMNNLISNIGSSGDTTVNAQVTYVRKDERTYEEDFIEALAQGTGPDLFLLQQDAIVQNLDKIIPISYKSLPERRFKDSFIEEGEMYLREEGILGIPLMVDPLVMYWNRDIFQTASIAKPPQFWDELFVLSPKITQRDTSSNIERSLVALGEFRNIKNAKQILSALIMQSGNKIVVPSADGGFISILGSNLKFTTQPAGEALRFYTEFSNPIKSVYSWNRALSNSRQAFISGDLALYFGFASELSGITRSNPNLNFDISTIPQIRDADTKVTYGNMSAFSIPKNSKNPQGALFVALSLTSKENIRIFSRDSALPPVRRDLLVDEPPRAIDSVFNDSALMSKSWFDPDSDESDIIFKNMIESVISGKSRLHEAVSLASEELNVLLDR